MKAQDDGGHTAWSVRSRERVAIVGSGLAGLVSAHLLANDTRQRYDVTIFESGSTCSFDAASVSIPIPNANGPLSDRVDLPMRAFASGYYHNLRALYDYLGVAYHSQRFLFDFGISSTGTHTGNKVRDTSYFTHASNLHQLPPRPANVDLLEYVSEVAYLLVSYVWFLLCCLLVSSRAGETLQDYLDRTRIPCRFVTNYLLPLMSSVATCPHATLLSFPASDIIEYKRRTHGAPHFCVSKGVSQVQTLLVQNASVQMNAMVIAVEPCDRGARISWTQGYASSGKTCTDHFDKVILAVAPDVVSRIFQPLHHHMSQIPTLVVESIVHTDKRIMDLSDSLYTKLPTTQLIRLHTSMDPMRKTEAHHLQPCGAVVTTSPISPIDTACIVHAAKFTRVLRNPRSQRIVNAIFGETLRSSHDKSLPQWRNGQGNVWLVGGWCWDGMVLLEGCVISAMRVARAFDVNIPWQQ